ncbi:MAG TPA: hypothetical protein PKD70_11230 [Saprospiraceae bacterium]|nr:hypothetical protein [Saprospiraceae bacterium]HMP14444.1 hypothetical protein [Saprospiraceae bacterium]
MYREIYLTLKQHLSTDVVSLKLIEWDLSQYDQVQEDAVVTTPSAYIRFDDIEWGTLNRYVQRGVMNFSVSLVNQTAFGDGQDMTDQSYINHLATENEIYRSLQGRRFSLQDVPGINLSEEDDNPVLIETIERTGYEPHSELDNLIVTRQSFRATVFDYSAHPEYQEVTADLQFDVKLKKDINHE